MYRMQPLLLLLLICPFLLIADPIEIRLNEKGLTVEDAFITLNDERFEEDTLHYSATYYLNMSGLRGLSIKDDKVFVGCSMYIEDKQGNQYLKQDDLFSSYDATGIDVQLGRYLNVSLLIGTPLEMGIDYTWKLVFWDKINQSSIEVEIPFHVGEIEAVEDEIGIDVNNSGLKSQNVYLSKDGTVMKDNVVSYFETVYFNLTGVEGFTVQNGRVYPGAGMVLLDQSGNIMMEYSDLFQAYDTEGVSPEDSRFLNLSLKIGDPMKPGQEYFWQIRVWDKKGGGQIEGKVKILVE